eukprot:GHVU01234794.1.p1 GENE.GHVU01234794.1~~GHVU01234794.1.p1  ORF type:complete len:179 (+),score=6.32 GHVU01234794.1:82-618(+)
MRADTQWRLETSIVKWQTQTNGGGFKLTDAPYWRRLILIRVSSEHSLAKRLPSLSAQSAPLHPIQPPAVFSSTPTSGATTAAANHCASCAGSESCGEPWACQASTTSCVGVCWGDTGSGALGGVIIIVTVGRGRSALFHHTSGQVLLLLLLLLEGLDLPHEFVGGILCDEARGEQRSR